MRSIRCKCSGFHSSCSNLVSLCGSAGFSVMQNPCRVATGSPLSISINLKRNSNTPMRSGRRIHMSASTLFISDSCFEMTLITRSSYLHSLRTSCCYLVRPVRFIVFLCNSALPTRANLTSVQCTSRVPGYSTCVCDFRFIVCLAARLLSLRSGILLSLVSAIPQRYAMDRSPKPIGLMAAVFSRWNTDLELRNINDS